MPAEQKSEFVGIIVKESERLTRLIDDVLDIAKMEAGEIEWRLESHDPRPIIEEAIQASAGPFKQDGTNLSLEIEIAENLPVVNVEPDRLTQVVVNLISNAIKFSDKDERLVKVRAKGIDGALHVSIEDNGIGIEPEDQAKVFQRFQQVGNTLTEKPKGTGLGLPICVEIIKYFGGEIGVESELSRGSTFWFRLPPVAPLDEESSAT